MKQCKNCRIRAESENGICPVCGIDQEGKELSRRAKKVRFHARAIRTLAVLHLIIGVMSIMMMSEFSKPFAIAILAAINIVLAYGLVRFSRIAYKAAVGVYFFFGMVNVISIQHGVVHLGGIAFALIALYIVGNATSKAIFDRQLSGGL